MSRADVHYAMAVDAEIWEASRFDPTLLDPVVRVDSVPGMTRPLVVVRDYQGPQGYYLESFTITDTAGRVVHTSPEQKIRLSGEQDEERVVTRIPRLRLTRGDEHTVTLFVNGVEMSSIPMFVEVGAGGDAATAVEETFAKALQKGTVVWVVVPPDEPTEEQGWFRRRPKAPRRGLVYPERHQPAWFVLEGGKVYVLSGPTEQQIDGLRDGITVDLVARSKDHQSQVARVPADVRAVPADDPLFEQVAQAGMGRRLNLPDGEGALERWRQNCTLFELTPRFSVFGSGGGGAATAGTGAAAPAAAAADGGEAPAAEAKKARPEDDIHVEAQIDQEVFDQLIAEGKSERVARAKAKAAYVRREKQRILAEQG